MTERKRGPLLRHPDRLYIDGQWAVPSSDATIDVTDSHTEGTFLTVPAAQEADLERAVDAARRAFDDGPWPRMSPVERAEFLRAFADRIRESAAAVAQIWPRESGILQRLTAPGVEGYGRRFESYADLAETYPFEERVAPTAGGNFGLLVREPVGVVGAIIAWNGPLGLMTSKIAPALLAGCTVVLKLAPEAPGLGYLLAEIADDVGLPAGVLNVVTAEREVSELLVRHPSVDKIAFTGSTAAGRRIASLCGERIARYTLELGGKSAALVLDDMDLAVAAKTLAAAGARNAGQVCAGLTRIIVTKNRHDELVEALAHHFSELQVGDPFDEASQMGPLAARRQRDLVERYIDIGVTEGADLATGGRRPPQLDRGWYVEPTVFGNVSPSSTIAQEEIFGPVLSVLAAEDDDAAVAIANDTIYGLNASVFTPDQDRAFAIARRLRSGTVGHNAFRADFGIAFGGFKQSGIGREGGREGLLPYFEIKTVIMDGEPTGYDAFLAPQ